MHAAVVTDPARPPAYAAFDDPVAAEGETLVRVTHAGQSSLAKAQASGKHYASKTAAAFVPGIDGVGTLADGTRAYFAFPRSPFGSMAEFAPVRREYLAAIPAGLDSLRAAASGNPGMSSYAGLTERAHFVRGESVLINGATSVSGRLAFGVAKHLGAKYVVVTGRDRALLDKLVAAGADAAISLDAEPAALVETFRREVREKRIDVVLDYLWGPPALALIEAISGKGAAEGEPRIRFVQIGSVAGVEIALNAKTLRSSGLELLGTGLGSVSYAKLIEATAAFFKAFVAGGFDIETAVAPLADVESTWNRAEGRSRLVFTV